MPTKISFDVEFVVASASDELKWLEVAKGFQLEKRAESRVAIRTAQSEISDVKMDVAMASYLSTFKEQGLLGHVGGAKLRVGCFVRIDQVACWTMDLTPPMISQLSGLGVELEITVYHCSPDGGEIAK